MDQEYVFQTPNDPQGYGVVLPAPSLRNLDMSALDFDMLRRALVEYIQTYFPTTHNDFFASNGFMMLMELTAYQANVLSQRSDILANESFLSTAQTKEAVLQHLQLINQSIRRATPATVDVEISINSPVVTELQIPAGVRFNFQGPNGDYVYYEVYRAPNDWTSPILIPPGKRGVIGFGIEGKTVGPKTVISNGGPNQYIDIDESNVLDEPIIVTGTVGSGTVNWRRVDVIEKSGPNDEVFEVRTYENLTRIVFGNDVAGKAPIAGEEISVVYRVGGGIRGRIGVNIINETRAFNPQAPANAPVEVLFRNLVPSQGGMDEESLEDAKKRAPREFATHNSATTGEDYSLLAQDYSHPVFGTVAKAIGIIRTGVDYNFTELVKQIQTAPSVEAGVELMKTNFINQNIVDLYVLAEGPSGTLMTPSVGLKQGLISYFSEINVLTDQVQVLDGKIKQVDVQAVVVVSRNADPGTVKVAVTDAINKFFDIRNFDMGTPLYLSNLYANLQGIPGIQFVNIFKPAGDIIKKDLAGASASDTVDFNEVITLGTVDIKFYFEQGNALNQ